MTLAEAMVPVMNVALVVGVAVVMPIAFDRRFTPWQVSALAVAASGAVSTRVTSSPAATTDCSSRSSCTANAAARSATGAAVARSAQPR